MNGAESLVRSLLDAGVEVCFANPGTSEMHFVSALDQVGGIRCVLGLFEGVVTGAADGYARMAGKPGVTLLHLGPGLANGLANLHNARKARTSIVNIVGEHALHHIEHDAPLTADIEGLARPVSHWVRTCTSADELAADALAALAAAGVAPGQVATLILPANTAWEPTRAAAASGDGRPADPASSPWPPAPPARVDAVRIGEIAAVLGEDGEGGGGGGDNGNGGGGRRVALVLGDDALRGEALEHAGRVARASGATLLGETFKARVERGAGRVAVPAVPYRVQDAVALLDPFTDIVTVGAKAPVAFFAYPDTRSELYPESARVHVLAAPGEDVGQALAELERALGAEDLEPERQPPLDPPRCADGPLDPESLANVVARLLPENAIVVDESITAGRGIYPATAGAPPHDWLQVCGGSIGGGFPLATGAAIACPDRPVICLEGDGSAMYTLQALWTQAREALDVTSIVLANRGYEILKHELENVQAQSGDIALDMMSLERPTLDWVAMAEGMGVAAERVSSVAEFERALAAALAAPGPRLIEAML